MRVAFYAPLKSPNHPVPSGDRQIAKLLMRALSDGGNEVTLAAEVRTFDGVGDADRQAAAREESGHMAANLIEAWRGEPEIAPAAWLTYHLYHKAPDWLGPAVTQALGIPYLVAEASFAPKQAGGPWDLGHRGVGKALGGAAAVLYLNPVDRACVAPLLQPGAVQMDLPPFVDTDRLARARETWAGARRALSLEFGLPDRAVWLLAVGMMRPGAKLESYRLLGSALADLGAAADWRLLVVGDGPARGDARQALAPVLERTAWLGERPPDALPGIMAASDLFVWPAMNEALGLAVLEAQACGLSAVVGDAGALPTLVRHEETGLVAPEGDADAFRAAVARLLGDTETRSRYGDAAAAHAAANHGIAAAATVLNRALGAVCRAEEAPSR